MKLFEYTLHDLKVSNLTKKTMDQDGDNPVTLITAKFDGDDLFMLFEATSLKDHHRYVDLKGGFQPARYGYSVSATFYGAKKYANGSFDEKALNDIISNCDVKVYCNCPAFYWQGMAEDDVDTAKFAFQGAKGSHIWAARHNASGNYTRGLQICKHIDSVRGFILLKKSQIISKIKSSMNESRRILYSRLRENQESL